MKIASTMLTETSENMKDFQNYIIFAAMLFFVAYLIRYIWLFANRWSIDTALKEKGLITEAIILDSCLLYRNVWGVKFSFELSAPTRKYIVVQEVGRNTVNKLQSETIVAITYLPSNPEIAKLAKEYADSSVLASHTLFFVIIMIVFPPLAILFFIFYYINTFIIKNKFKKII
jgi:hypothetical protein